jgi:hypothetical protein
MSGSVSIAGAPAAAATGRGLLDELHLLVHPIAVRHGLADSPGEATYDDARQHIPRADA